jgi:hypothetical protein
MSGYAGHPMDNAPDFLPPSNVRVRCYVAFQTGHQGVGDDVDVVRSEIPVHAYGWATLNNVIDISTSYSAQNRCAGNRSGADKLQLWVRCRRYRRSLRRHDQRLSEAADADTLACKAGCAWCCHFSVDVRPVEVLNILEFMQATFSTAEQQRLRIEIEANSRVLGSLDEMQRMQQMLKCAFLADGRCGIYGGLKPVATITPCGRVRSLTAR